MGINIGLDIGAISLKLAALGKPADRPTLESVCAAHPEFRLISLGERPLLLSDYRRISGSPIQSTYDLLRELYEIIPEDRVEGMRVTGSGSRTIAKVLGLFFENEFKAIARMIGTWYPEVRTVFELGGESSKYIRLENGGIQDYDRSGECAAGTGSFLDQQALRMQYSVEEVGELVCGAGCAARIAGRCSVFAKSDMIHAQQKGYSPAEILRGLCDAVARNFKSSVVKGRPVEARVALIGAVSQNAGVVGALREAFSLTCGTALRSRGIRLVRRDRHGDSGGRGAAQTLHSGRTSLAAARCGRELPGHQAALHGKRGATARPGAGLHAAGER